MEVCIKANHWQISNINHSRYMPAVQKTIATITNLDQEVEQTKMASTKEILDMCFSENVFTSTQHGFFKKGIPCLNKYKYKTEVVPILETDQISKEEMMNLPC